MTAGPKDGPAMEDTRQLMERFTDLLYRKREVRRAFEDFVADEYLQHNPSIADGRQAAVDFLAAKFGGQGVSFEVQRLLVDGDHAAVHLRAIFPGRPILAVVDLYRIEDGRIAEHWDVLQPVPATAANAHPMF